MGGTLADEMASTEDWYVYVVECSDGSLYTGIAKDVDHRIEAHNAGKGAKYTKGRGPVVLLKSTGPMGRGEALKKERAVKKLKGGAKLSALEG